MREFSSVWFGLLELTTAWRNEVFGPFASFSGLTVVEMRMIAHMTLALISRPPERLSSTETRDDLECIGSRHEFIRAFEDLVHDRLGELIRQFSPGVDDGTVDIMVSQLIGRQSGYLFERMEEGFMRSTARTCDQVSSSERYGVALVCLREFRDGQMLAMGEDPLRTLILDRPAFESRNGSRFMDHVESLLDQAFAGCMARHSPTYRRAETIG